MFFEFWKNAVHTTYYFHLDFTELRFDYGEEEQVYDSSGEYEILWPNIWIYEAKRKTSRVKTVRSLRYHTFKNSLYFYMFNLLELESLCWMKIDLLASFYLAVSLWLSSKFEAEFLLSAMLVWCSDDFPNTNYLVARSCWWTIKSHCWDN